MILESSGVSKVFLRIPRKSNRIDFTPFGLNRIDFTPFSLVFRPTLVVKIKKTQETTQRGKCRECRGEGEAAGEEERGREEPETQRREKRARTTQLRTKWRVLGPPHSEVVLEFQRES